MAASASGSGASLPKLADVERENAELKAKIAALKQKLGITAREEKEEIERVKSVFAMFDRDNDGTIDKAEFELLAFECGTDVAALTPENIQKSFAAINTKGDGKIAFDDFLRWLKSDKGIKSSKGAQLGLLRMKLQSKAWMAKLNDVRQRFGKDGKDSKGADAKEDVKAAPAKLPELVRQKSAEKPDLKLINVGVNVGDFGAAKSGVYVDIGENAALAAETKATVQCPDGITLFAFIDFALKDGFDESKVGELCGALESLVNAVPWQALPLQVYNSHTVDVANGADGKKVLRVSIFSSFDVDGLATQYLSESTDLKPSQVLTGNVKVEFPFELADLTQPNFRLTPDVIKSRFSAIIDVNSGLRAPLEAALAKGSLPADLWGALAAFFVKGIAVNVSFANLSDFLKQIPDDAAGARGGARRAPGQELKHQLNELAALPIADMLPQMTGMIPALAAQVGQEALYEQFKDSLLGLRTIHLQSNNFVARIQLKGVDFVPLFP